MVERLWVNSRTTSTPRLQMLVTATASSLASVQGGWLFGNPTHSRVRHKRSQLAPSCLSPSPRRSSRERVSFPDGLAPRRPLIDSGCRSCAFPEPSCVLISRGPLHVPTLDGPTFHCRVLLVWPPPRTIRRALSGRHVQEHGGTAQGTGIRSRVASMSITVALSRWRGFSG